MFLKRIYTAIPKKNRATIRVSGTKSFLPIIAKLRRFIVKFAYTPRKSSSSLEQVFLQLLKASKMVFGPYQAIKVLKLGMD